jgi:transposase
MVRGRRLAFQLSTSPEAPANFKEAGRWLSKQPYLKIAKEHLALARQHADMEKQRLALDRKKWPFNAARQALEHHAELGEILK